MLHTLVQHEFEHHKLEHHNTDGHSPDLLFYDRPTHDRHNVEHHRPEQHEAGHHDAHPVACNALMTRANRLVFRLLTAALGVLLLMLVLSGSVARAAAQTAQGLDEVTTGQLLFTGTAGQSFQPAIMQRSNVHFSIAGMIATVSLEQVFRNHTREFVEGVYAFPLPPEAAVRALEMRLGERRITGKIREKEAAKSIYREAKHAGRKASLVEQQRPNLFTNRIANIAPGEEVSIRLEYVQTVYYHSGKFSLRFPMTITPRYMPGVPLRASNAQEALSTVAADPYLGWAMPTDEVPDAHRISPLLLPPGLDNGPAHNRISLSATLDMGMPLSMVSSPYHEIVLSRRAGVYDLSLLDGSSAMDRDFVLEWQPVAGSAPEAAFFTQKVDDQYYGMLMVVPPAQPAAIAKIPRQVIFVIDTSGSMGGTSIEQARASLSTALRQLTPRDTFNIIAFDSSHRALHRQPVPATAHFVQQALEFVRMLHASGGTQMMPALLAALPVVQDHGNGEVPPALRQVVFITDGAVGNEDELFQAISQRLGDSRLFTVGIGSAPNSWFMRKAAESGRGTHTSIGNLQDVGPAMASLFEQLARPAAVDFAIEWPAAVEAWPRQIPDLYFGEPLTISVSFGDTAPVGDITVRGRVGGTPWQRRIDVNVAAGSDQHPGVASVWARRKIADLLDAGLRGLDAAAVRDAVLPVALAHQLLSPFTSFVAVEEVVSRPPEVPFAAHPVPNTQPHGQAAQPYAYPATATTGPAKMWFAVLLLFLALVLHVLRQGEPDHAAPPEQD